MIYGLRYNAFFFLGKQNFSFGYSYFFFLNKLNKTINREFKLLPVYVLNSNVLICLFSYNPDFCFG